MLDPTIASDLDHVEVTGKIGLEIGAWVLDRIADAGLCTEMDDPVEVFAIERCLKRDVIGEIDLLEREAGTQLGELGQPGMLQRDVVIVVEAVDAEHRVTPCEQVAADVKADKPGRTGNENAHAYISHESLALKQLIDGSQVVEVRARAVQNHGDAPPGFPLLIDAAKGPLMMVPRGAFALLEYSHHVCFV